MSGRTFSLPLAAAALLAVSRPLAAQSPYPERVGVVAHDASVAVSVERVNGEFAERIGDPYGLRGLVLMVRSCRPDPEVYLDGALPHYDLARGPGLVDDDALAILVCQEPRYVGLYYSSSSRYASRFDETAVADAMSPHLAAGDFTGAVTAGLTVLAAQLSGPTAPAAVGTSLAHRARWPIALLAACAAAVGAFALYRGQRGRGRSRTKAPSLGAAQQLEQKMAELRRDLRPDSADFSRLVLAYESLGDEAVLELNRRHSRMIERLGELERQAEALTAGVVPEAMSQDPELAAERYKGPTEDADALLAYVHELHAESDHVAMLLDRAPVLAVEAREAIRSGMQQYESDRPSAQLPAAEGVFRLAVELADEAEQRLSAADRITAGRLAESAIRISQRAAGVGAEMRAAAKAIEDASTAFQAVDDYAPSSWADIRGNGSEAEESLAAARELVQRIADSPRSAYGQDPAAGYGESLERVYAEIARAKELSAAVGARLQAIEAARDHAAADAQSVRSEIAEARQWLSGPSVDVDVDEEPGRKLRDAESALSAAEAAMLAAPADWPAIARQVQEVDRMVDAALADARDQQQRMAALARQATGGAAEARASLDKADRFLDAHRADVGDEAASALTTARDALRRADDAQREAEAAEDAVRAAGLRQAIDAYARARDLAEAAYETMQRDFDAAERQREPHVPRVDWVGPMVPLPMGMPPIGRAFRGLPATRSVVLPRSPGRWGGAGGVGRPSGGGRRGGGHGW